jgi:hypothetical protein
LWLPRAAASDLLLRALGVIDRVGQTVDANELRNLRPGLSKPWLRKPRVIALDEDSPQSGERDSIRQGAKNDPIKKGQRHLGKIYFFGGSRAFYPRRTRLITVASS